MSKSTLNKSGVCLTMHSGLLCGPVSVTGEKDRVT